MIEVRLQRLDDGEPALDLPRRMRAGDAAADVPARLDVVIAPGGRALVATGFAVAVPEGMFGLLLPRSGLALEEGVTVLNSPGLIDAGYRGELKVLLHNTSDAAVRIERGQRIAQLLVLEVGAVRYLEVDELPAAGDDRGTAGFGSSGR